MIAWHYTTVENARKIRDSGSVLPTAVNVAAHERPVLWFSKNQYWDTTANKAMQSSDGTVRQLSMEEMCDNTDGLARFGIDESNLIPWPTIGVIAKINKREMEDLESVGINAGSDPSDWCGTFSAIPVEECIIEFMVPRTREWFRVSLDKPGGADIIS